MPRSRPSKFTRVRSANSSSEIDPIKSAAYAVSMHRMPDGASHTATEQNSFKKRPARPSSLLLKPVCLVCPSKMFQRTVAKKGGKQRVQQRQQTPEVGSQKPEETNANLEKGFARKRPSTMGFGSAIPNLCFPLVVLGGRGGLFHRLFVCSVV